MADPPVAQAGTGGLQAPNAHLPSDAAWQRPGSQATPTLNGPVARGETPRRASGHQGQPRQTHGRRGWGESADPAATAAPCAHTQAPDQGQTGPPRLDTKAG